jgi:hypothetical protein
MSPLDSELRRTLTQHASDVDTTSDLWLQVEHRARALHRRRIALAGASGAGVVAAVVVLGLTMTGGSQADRVVLVNPGPSDSALTSPSPAVSPTAPGGGLPVTEWPRVGPGPTWVHWDAVLQSMPDQMPSGFAPLGAPAAIGSGDTDGGAVAVFVVKAGSHLVAGAVLRSAPDEAVAVHDIASDGDVPYVGVVVHVPASGGGVDDGIVVGAPDTGQIEFKLPQEPDFHAVEGGTDPRWAAVTLGQVRAGQPVAQVRVLDGDGNADHAVYTGPIQVGITFPAA